MDVVRLGGGSAMWGDAYEPALDLAKSGEVDYIGFDMLGELGMSIMHKLRLRNPQAGYSTDIMPRFESLIPIAREKSIRLVTNGGGANSESAGRAVADLARRNGWNGLKVGTVVQPHLIDDLDEIAASGWVFENLDTGEQGLDRIRDRIVAADPYTGSEGIVEALGQGADVVITGRTSDNALWLGPLMHEYGWAFDDGHRDDIATGIITGHLIECGPLVTGGLSTQWRLVKGDKSNLGYPIADVTRDGRIRIRKLPGTGGVINEFTVKEQLLYEVHDPARYLMPDGVADLTDVRVREVAEDEVEVTGVRGHAPTDTLKLMIGYQDGWIGEGMILCPWPDALARAEHCVEMIRGRTARLGVELEELRFSYVGINELGGPLVPMPAEEPSEVALRVAARARTRAAVEAVTREVTHLWIMGPAGMALHTPPPAPRPVISLWPTLVPRDAVCPRIRTAVEEVR
jgi:hypothetical protein